MSSLASILLVGSSTVITGIINYLYHPVMLKFLPIATFAEFESLIGVFNVLGVITGSFILFLVKEIAKHREKEMAAKFVFIHLGWLLFGVGVGMYLIYLLLLPFTQSLLQIDEWIPVALVGTMLVTSFINTPPGAVMQALEKFRFIAASNIVGAILRLGLGVGFIFLGANLTFAILGFLTSNAIAVGASLVYVWWILRNTPSTDEDMKREIEGDFKKELPNLLQFFILSVLLAVIMNMDIILATSFFDKEIAGGYAAISVLAKFIMFVIGAIETVYYPKITGAKEVHLARIFMRNAAVLMLLAMTCGIFGAWIFGDFVLHILKPGFAMYNSLLLGLILVFGLYAMITFFSKVLIASKNYLVNFVLLAVVLIFIIPVVFSLGTGIFFYATLLLVSMSFGVIGVGSLLVFGKR